MIESLVMPSDSAWKLVSTRCRSTGCASARMSSKLTWYRPLVSARALPPRIRYCAARTLAPNATHFLTTSGGFFPFGRVMRTSSSAYRITDSATGTRRTSRWNATRSAPETGRSNCGSRIAVVVFTTMNSSSSGGCSMTMWNMKRSSWASGSGYVPSSSMGFCVANTKNGSSSVYVRPWIVTRCSCIASRSADCVFGGVRLISSASTMFAKIGPGANTIWRRPLPGSSWMMSVPVMSDGIRSGVNWMRLNRSSSTCASVAISSVFARPGTPTIRLLPPTNSVANTSSMTSSCPTILFFSSLMTAFRPAFILSASATSSADSRPSRVTFTGPPDSVRQSVDDVVHAHLVRFVRFVDRAEPCCRELPEVRDVGAVVHHDHHPFLRVVVLEDAVELRLVAVVRLRDDLERRDLEERVKDDHRRVERQQLRTRNGALDVRLHVRPALAGAAVAVVTEVVEDEEAALFQVRREPFRFLVGHRPETGLRHVGDRVVHQHRVVQREHVAAVRMRMKVGHFIHDLHQVRFGLAAPAERIGNVAVRPCRQAAVVVAHAAAARRVLDASERESAVVRNVFRRRLIAGAVAEDVEALREGGGRDSERQQRREDETSGPHFFASI